MEIIELTEDNVEEYSEYLGPDKAENIGREYYRGIVVINEKKVPESAAIWELLHLEDEKRDTEARVETLLASDESAAEVLLNEFEHHFEEDDVRKSYLELPADEKIFTPELLEKAGYSCSRGESREIEILLGDLLKMPIARKNKAPSYIKELGSLMVRPFRRGVMDCIFHSKRPLMDDLGTISMSWFDQQISSYVETDGRVSGFLLIHKTPLKKMRIEVFSASGPDARKDLLYMIIFSLKQAEKYYSPDTEVLLRRKDEYVKALTDYLLPDITGKEMLCASREEG